MRFWGKCPNLTPQAGRYILCHGCCHIGTKLSCDALKLSKSVQKTFCEVLQALNQAKQTAGSQDMIFLAKKRTIPAPLKKGLRNVGHFWRNHSLLDWEQPSLFWEYRDTN